MDATLLFSRALVRLIFSHFWVCAANSYVGATASRLPLLSQMRNLSPPVQAGAEPVIFERCRLVPTFVTIGLSENDPKCWEEMANVGLPWVLNNAAFMSWQLDKFYKENRPDLIIYGVEVYRRPYIG